MSQDQYDRLMQQGYADTGSISTDGAAILEKSAAGGYLPNTDLGRLIGAVIEESRRAPSVTRPHGKWMENGLT